MNNSLAGTSIHCLWNNNTYINDCNFKGKAQSDVLYKTTYNVASIVLDLLKIILCFFVGFFFYDNVLEFGFDHTAYLNVETFFSPLFFYLCFNCAQYLYCSSPRVKEAWNSVFIHALYSYPSRLLQNKSSISSIPIKPARESMTMENNLWHLTSFKRHSAILNVWKSVSLKNTKRLLLAELNIFQCEGWYVYLSCSTHKRGCRVMSFALLKLSFGSDCMKCIHKNILLCMAW